MFGFVSDELEGSQFVHVVEMDDGMFSLVASSLLFVEPRNLKRIGGRDRAAVRICCTRRVGPDAESVIKRVAQILRGTRVIAPRTYDASEKAVVLAVELACELVAVPPDQSAFDETHVTEFLTHAMNMTVQNRRTKHPKSFGLTSEPQAQIADVARKLQIDHVFSDDAVDVARCLKVSRAGDTVTLLGKVTLSSSQRTLFEWHGVKVDVAK